MQYPVNRKRRRPSHLFVVAAFLTDFTEGYSAWGVEFRRQSRSTNLQYTESRSDHTSLLETATERDESYSIVWKRPWNDSSEPASSLPPWLRRYARPDLLGEVDQDWLEISLIRRHRMARTDAREITHCYQAAAGSDPAMTLGLSDFLRLVLDMEEENDGASSLVSKDFLIACIIHYADCLALRKPATTSWFPNQRDDMDKLQWSLHAQVQTPTILPSSLSVLSTEAASTALAQQSCEESALLIAHGAARLKRAEVLAQTNTPQRDFPEQQLRNLLLTVMEDWRSLALRCIACLYRLEGILAYQRETRSLATTPEIVRTAREAMRVFAVLSERLGMHRLKAKIEERAFGILYKRQYQAVSALYDNSGLPMEKLSKHLTRSVTKTLQSDDALMAQLEDLQVTSRVKEPFSFWKKLLKRRYRHRALPGDANMLESSSSVFNMTLQATSREDSLAINELHDGIALRIILKARKWTEDESEESVRAREHLLCYYVQKLLRSKWPEYDSSRVKDYIALPKPNGYQSLHHTSMVLANGIRFPFEVQIRSLEMHRFAEFGLAAHWDYKLGSVDFRNPTIMLPSPSVATDSRNRISQGIAGLLPPSTSTPGFVHPVSSMDDRSLPATTASTVAILTDSERYIQALVNEKERVQSEAIYVFLVGNTSSGGQGRLISLPVNSSVADAVKSADELSESCSLDRVWKNGKLAQLSDTLENGDFIVLALEAEQVSSCR